MKLTFTSCVRGHVYFGETCAQCDAYHRANPRVFNQFWSKGKDLREWRKSSIDSLCSPIWAIPFKLLWLPVQLVYRLVKNSG